MKKTPLTILKRNIISVSSEELRVSKPRKMSELLKNSLVIIDKPAGPTSHQVSDFVKKILSGDKAGHLGTLDPNVTGVLPVALDNGTKIIQALLNAGKEYICLMHVHNDIPESKLRETIKSFEGKIKQLPPVKSAVKRQERFRTIHYIDILEISGRDILFRVGCQAGTYIRKLCFDMGVKLNSGAHMAELRRTIAGPFYESQAITLQDLSDAFYEYKKNQNEIKLRKILIPIENSIDHLGKVWVKDSSIKTLCQGAQLNMPGIVKIHSAIKKGDLVAVMSLDNEIILLGESKIDTTNEKLNEKAGLAVKTLRVFIKN